MRGHLEIFAASLLTVSSLLAQPVPEYAPSIKVATILRTTTTSAGQPIVYPKTDHPEVTALSVEIPPGAETGWHRHPFPCYGYILSGTLLVEIKGHGKHIYRAGDAVAETVNLFHNGRNEGKVPVRLVMFVMGEKGRPFTVKAAKQGSD